MEIFFFKEISSTQKELIKALKEGKVTPPIAYFSTYQTQGVGSRGNSWIGQKGNFFLSVALSKKELPNDLPLASSSLYFTFLFRECLREPKVWLKWPNDLYLGSKKVGGALTNLVGEILVYGVGLNVVSAPQGFERVEVSTDKLLECFLKRIEQKPSWKQVFSKYKIEFDKHRSFYTNINGKKVAIDNAELAEDGALILNGERVYSLR